MSKLTPLSFVEHEEASARYQIEPASVGLKITMDQKWLAVSQMQKAIRRGEATIAVDWGHALWQADRSYGLFRLAVIAAEEVAGADPALARGFLQSSIKKDWFSERGGFSCMAYFIEAFAHSVKDRTSCDLASVASLKHLPTVEAKGELDYASLRAIATDAGAGMPARVSALWLLAGTQKIPNKSLGAERPGQLMAFLGACDAIHSDPDLIATIDWSLRLNKEPNPVALALCRAAQNEALVETDLLVASVPDGSGGLLAAIDAHTREGRTAIQALLAQSIKAQSLCKNLSGKEDKSKLLGSIFFRLEGHECSPRLDYALAEKTQSWHRRRLAKIAEVPENDLFTTALELLPELHALRQAQAPAPHGASGMKL